MWCEKGTTCTSRLLASHHWLMWLRGAWAAAVSSFIPHSPVALLYAFNFTLIMSHQVDQETSRGTPLTTAAGLGDVSTIKLLVGGKGLGGCIDWWGGSATRVWDIEVGFFLFCETICFSLPHSQKVERGARINSELKDGMTALMVASREDQREAVRELLQLGADPSLKSRYMVRLEVGK